MKMSSIFLPPFSFKAKYLTKKSQAGSVEAIRLLDELLLQLVVSPGLLLVYT